MGWEREKERGGGGAERDKERVNEREIERKRERTSRDCEWADMMQHWPKPAGCIWPLHALCQYCLPIRLYLGPRRNFPYVFVIVGKIDFSLNLQ